MLTVASSSISSLKVAVCLGHHFYSSILPLDERVLVRNSVIRKAHEVCI